MAEEIRTFTANYINTDSNFAIHNLRSGHTDKKDLPFYCVLNNILQRGCPTRPSRFLQNRFEDAGTDHRLRLISENIPDWEGVIKGGKGNNPAMTFFYEVIPHFFSDTPFLQQLIIPECPVASIIDDREGEFVGQAVDFYIPDARLVIEIDGMQHAGSNQKMLDRKRDAGFAKAGIMTVRIKTDDICKGNEGLEAAIGQIRRRLREDRYIETFSRIESDHKRPIESLSEVFKQVATIRLEITVVQLLLHGMLSRRDGTWKIAVRSREAEGYEHAAIEDILNWLENLYVLAEESFVRPEIDLILTKDLSSVPDDRIRIDLSVLEVGTPAYTKDRDTVYVTACIDQESDHFVVRTSEKISYFGGPKRQNDISVISEEKRNALLFFLDNLFGFSDFREGQEEIIINTLKCRDTIGVLPTGSGKSLCYQLCMLLQPCIHICISPIKALMVDQSQNMKKTGITRVTYISSDLTTEERNEEQSRFSGSRYILTLISPERFQSENFRAFILSMVNEQGVSFGYAVIDEVHCMSEWGHSFRVSYLNLVRSLRKYCGNVVLLGLTATASEGVLTTLQLEFGMDVNANSDVISVENYTRENLRFSVINAAKKDGDKNRDKYVALRELIDSFLKSNTRLFEPRGDDTDCGLIFTPNVNGDHGCKSLSERLKQDYKEYDADIRYFSGAIPNGSGFKSNKEFDEYKRDTQNEYKENRFPLLVATKAFGIGIDKSNIKYTIHYGLPSSREALYQEAGRAGRDEKLKEVQCAVILTPESRKTMELLRPVFKEFTPADKVKAITKVVGFDGEDVQRQLFLLARGLVTRQNEIECARYILDRIKESESSPVFARAVSRADFDMMQKVLYHMSVVGIVSDWTVDWKVNGVNIYPEHYDRDALIERTRKHISKFGEEEKVRAFTDSLTEETVDGYYEIPIIDAFHSWYESSIIYSRRMALWNVYEDCIRFKDSDSFKEHLEAFFKLDDLTDDLGSITEKELDYMRWFTVLNASTIRKRKIENVIMSLSRFLESHQYNVGLNYISGVLELLSDKDAPSMERMEHALRRINDMRVYEKVTIAEKTFTLLGEIGDERSRERISELILNSIEANGLETRAYSILRDDYSLSIIMKKTISSIIDKLEV